MLFVDTLYVSLFTMDSVVCDFTTIGVGLVKTFTAFVASFKNLNSTPCYLYKGPIKKCEKIVKFTFLIQSSRSNKRVVTDFLLAE